MKRKHSFGEQRMILIDKLLFCLRTKDIIAGIKKIPGPLSIIDIGCGYNPKLLEKILNKNSLNKAVGLDISVNPNYKSEKIKLINSEFESNIPFPDEQFHIAVSTAVIEHLEKYQLALDEMYRILKPNGFLFLTTPAPAAKPILEMLAFFRVIDPAEIADHKHYFSVNILKTILDKTGFKHIKTKKLEFGFNNLYIAQK